MATQKAKAVELAEQQLTGFAHARAGHDVEALAEGMGLSISEWERIKMRHLVRMQPGDVAALDAFFQRVG